MGHSRSVYSLTFSPDGQLLASGSDNETVKLWDPSTGDLRRPSWAILVGLCPNKMLIYLYWMISGYAFKVIKYCGFLQSTGRRAWHLKVVFLLLALRMDRFPSSHLIFYMTTQVIFNAPNFEASVLAGW
jgi:hypothetical protein